MTRERTTGSRDNQWRWNLPPRRNCRHFGVGYATDDAARRRCRPITVPRDGMLRVYLLGGLRVENDGVVLEGAVARRRPSAVLALIATAAHTGTSRDRIAALLWPESDSEHARNNLKQTLFAIRRDVGDVIRGTTQLR